jgi:hypothetical protein
LNAGRPGWKGLDSAIVEAARASLEAKNLVDPDFWSVVGQTELELYIAVAVGKLARAQKSLERGYQDLYRRVRAPWLWSSVFDTAQSVNSLDEHSQTRKESIGSIVLFDRRAHCGLFVLCGRLPICAGHLLTDSSGNPSGTADREKGNFDAFDSGAEPALALRSSLTPIRAGDYGQFLPLRGTFREMFATAFANCFSNSR